MKLNQKIAAPIAALTAIVFALGSATAAHADAKSDAADFLLHSLVSGQYLDGFSAGSPEFGFSLEALLQLSQYSNTKNELGAAKNYLLKDDRIIGSASGKNGYAFDAQSNTLNPAAAAKFAFVSAVLHAGNRDIRDGIVKRLASSKTNRLAQSFGSTFAHAWVVLALEANHKIKAANRLTKALVKLQRKDGGFSVDNTADSYGSSTDATGIALMALGALRDSGSAYPKAIAGSIKRAVGYLNKTKVVDHWEAWGDVDVNGTAYALMGLKAAKQNVDAGIAWLLGRVSATDGGITTPWSAGAGDRFATAQSLLILKHLSYSDLVHN